MKPLRSAFGVKLERFNDGLYEGDDVTTSVVFERIAVGWVGSVRQGDVCISETLGSSSMQACYRSMRGRVKNLIITLRKLDEA